MNANAREQRGSSWLETAVVAVILAVLAAFLLRAVQYVQEQSEKRAFELILRNLNYGLKFTIYGAHGPLPDATRLKATNPVQWLKEPMEGYIGEVDATEPIPPGAWAFVPSRAELVYRPHQTRHLEVEGGGELIRLRIDCPPQATSVELGDCRLRPGSRVQWFDSTY